MPLLRRWYYLVPVVYLAVILWVQPADRFVFMGSEHPPPYPLTGSASRWLTDDSDTLAYAIRAENSARGRKAGTVYTNWFDRATGFRLPAPTAAVECVEREATGEPIGVADQKHFVDRLGRPGEFADRYFLEYPPLALWLFRLGLIGAPPADRVHPLVFDAHQYFVGCHSPRPPEEAEPYPDEVQQYRRFRHAQRVYAVLMVLAHLGLMRLIDRHFPGSPTWLLVLPGFLYYTPCRFDILPALLVLASVLAADRRRVGVSGLLLGLAVGLKMYPLVLAPILLRFTARSWKDAVVWCGCAALPVVGSYAVMLATDGVEGATRPLQFQLSRDPEPMWCFYDKFLPMPLAHKTPLWSAVRTGIPVLASVLLSLARPPSVASVLRRSFVAVVVFLSLSVFYSPQWWQWLAVLLVPLAARPPDKRVRAVVWSRVWLLRVPLRGRPWGLLAAGVFLDLLTYLQFPLLFDAVGEWVEPARVAHVWARGAVWLVATGAFVWREVRPRPAATV